MNEKTTSEKTTSEKTTSEKTTNGKPTGGKADPKRVSRKDTHPIRIWNKADSNWLGNRTRYDTEESAVAANPKLNWDLFEVRVAA